MTASPYRASTTDRKRGIKQLRDRVSIMRAFVNEVDLVGAELGHVHNRGRMTLQITGTFRAEAEFSWLKTRAATGNSHAKRRRREGASNAASLAQFFRTTEALQRQREARKSISADKTERRPPTAVYAESTRELECALTKAGHSFVRAELDAIKDYLVRVILCDAEGSPVSWLVQHRRQQRQPHEAFSCLRPAERTVTATVDADGNMRLHCSCLLPAMMGFPCRHMCAVNGGATHSDVVVRWHMSSLKGHLNGVVFAGRPQRYVGAVMTEHAKSW